MKIAPALLAAALALALSACGNNDDDRTGDETVGTGMNADASAAAGTTGPGAMGADAGTVGAADAMGAAGAGMNQNLAEGDHRALAAVQEVDRHEIAAAGDALSKNVQGDVRSYAETLRDDHTRNLEATQRLLGNTGPGTGMAGHDGMTGTTGAAGTGTAGTTGSGVGSTGTTATAAMAGGTAMPEDAELRAMREKHDAERQRLSQLEGDEFATAWVAAMVQGHEEALAKLDNELIPNATDAQVTAHLQTTRTAISGHLDTARALQSANR